MASVLALLVCGLTACQGPTPTPVRPVTIIEIEGERPHARVTVPLDATDPVPQVVTATPNASHTPSPTRTPTQTPTAGPTPESTLTWMNDNEALGEIPLPTSWESASDLTGSVTVTHPVDWVVSERGMYELSFMPPRHAWAKVRLVAQPLAVSGSGEGLAALAEEMRAIEAGRNEMLQVEEALYQEPLRAALVSLYARDPLRRHLLCQVVHVWLPLEDGRHVYGTLGRYDAIAPAVTAEELDTLILMMVAAARQSTPARP